MSWKAMFVRILSSQWLWARVALVPAVVAAFTVPILSVQRFGNAEVTGWQIRFLVNQLQNWTPAYPVLASAIGLLLGLTAWGADHRTGHVYALSLPVPRWRFTLFRMGAGGVLLALPVFALWVGTVIAAGTAEIPATLHAYPHALTARFLLATMMAFAVFFAIASTTSRTAAVILLAVVGVGLSQLFLALFGSSIDIVGPAVDMITSWPGPLEVFGGRWMLIDF